jgi:hypothetical protein
MASNSSPLLAKDPFVNDDFYRDGKNYSPLALLCTPFVIFQTILNVVLTYGGVFFCFWIIFVVFGKDAYGCYSPEVLSPILISPFATPILALAWTPLGMIDAVEKGYFGSVRTEYLSRGIWTLFVFLKPQIGVLRHIILGIQIAIISIPIMMLVVVFGIASYDDLESIGSNCSITDWQQVISCVTYIGILPIFIIPLGLLGFASERNLERVFDILKGKSFIQKGIYSPLC